MDGYWICKGGQDPVHYFKKYPGRFELAHVKDMNNNEDRRITCVKNGIIDFKRILNMLMMGGTIFHRRNERAIKGIECTKESYNYIEQLLT